MELEVGCHLVFQLPWHGNLTLPESCSLGTLMQRTRFDPVVIPSVWLPFFCLFPVSLPHPACEWVVLFKASWGLSSPCLVVEEMSWLLFSGNVLPTQHFQWMAFLFSSVLSLKLSAAFSQYHQNYYYNFKLSDVQKSSTVLMLLACLGLNRNIPSCWLGVSHCPVLSFCSLLFKARSCRNLGTGASILCAAPSTMRI